MVVPLLMPLQADAQTSKDDRVIRLWEELTNAHGPSGFEGPVREILTREFTAAGLEISTDGLGSVIGVARGAAPQPRIMVVAHMDEIGLMVRYITDEGFIKFQTLGGWLDQALIDQRWIIRTNKGPVLAISGIRAIHIASSDIRGRVVPSSEIFLDVGASSKKGAEVLGIRPGDPIAPLSPFTPMGNNRYAAKAWDARVGCALMIEAARRFKEQGIKTPGTIYFVGSVQEEVGMRGAQTASRVIKPDLGISLEVGITTDHPGVGPDLAQERLGKGPGIFLHDSSMLPNLKLRDFFLRVSEKEGIPLQTEVISGYGEDASAIQMHASGTPAINFTVPTRYVHSHTGIIDRADFDHALNLLMKVLVSLDAKTVAEISSF
jgi:endoglucanase